MKEILTMKIEGGYSHRRPKKVSKRYHKKSSEQRCKVLLQTSSIFNKFTFKLRSLSNSSSFEADWVLYRILYRFWSRLSFVQNGTWFWSRLGFVQNGTWFWSRLSFVQNVKVLKQTWFCSEWYMVLKQTELCSECLRFWNRLGFVQNGTWF